MIFEQHIPQGYLSNFIDNFVFFEGYTAEHLADKLLPDGGIYLIMNMLEKPEKLYKDISLKDHTEFTGSFLSGQHKGFIFIEAHHSSNMATKFKLGGAFPFFSFPISKINNKVIQLEPILGNSVELTRKRIIAEKNVANKFSILEEYYMSILRKDHAHNETFHEVLKFLAEFPHLASIKELSQKIGVSQKHLITLFSNQVGLTPKALARIFRFQKVIMLLEEKKEIDWMQIVTDCGYYDQAHFSKDFFEFSGINPSCYFKQKGNYVNYIPVT